MSLKIKIGLTAALVLSFLFIHMYFTPDQKLQAAELTQSVAAPFPAADIPMDSYIIGPDSLVNIKRSTGTRIKIGPGSFSKKDGSAFRGPVELKVREFHSAADMLRAGIPMNVKAGSEDLLQSAGMIEMRAYAAGEELEIKDGKSIAVDLAGYRPAEGYDLYYLKDNSEWIIPGEFKADVNKGKADRLEELSKLPKKPEYSDSLKNYGMTFELAGNLYDAPYLTAFAGRKWRIYGPYNESDVKKAFRINWDDVGINLIDKEKMIYEMVFSRSLNTSSDGGKAFQEIKLKAAPVLDDCTARGDSGLFQSQMKDYLTMLKKAEEEKKRLEGEASLINSFEIQKMGIYNIDRMMKIKDPVITSVQFDFDNELEKRVNHVKIFALLKGENSLIQIKSDERKKIRLFPGTQMELVAFLPDNTVAVIDNAQIEAACRLKKAKIEFISTRYPAEAYLRRGGEMLAKN